MERPEFWVEIVNDPAFTVDRCREALVALFQRHFPPGTRLTRFHELPGTSGWYRQNTLFNSSMASNLPFNNRGKCVYMYQPDLMRSSGAKRYGNYGAVYFSLSKYVSEGDLVSILNGGRSDGEIRIVDLGASPGPVLRP